MKLSLAPGLPCPPNPGLVAASAASHPGCNWGEAGLKLWARPRTLQGASGEVGEGGK